MKDIQQLTITTSSGRPLRPLVEDALRRELAILEAGRRRTQQRLQDFETHYGLPTEVFLGRIQDGSLDETIETIEWIGEHKLLERLSDKIILLQEIHLAD